MTDVELILDTIIAIKDTLSEEDYAKLQAILKQYGGDFDSLVEMARNAAREIGGTK